MKILEFLVISVFCSAMAMTAYAQNDQRQYDRAIEKLNQTVTKTERFYALGDAAKAAYNVGNMDQARYLTEELQRMMAEYSDDWNYGNAVHDVHVVLGRLAISEGRIEAAKAHLLEAGKSPGSPQLKTFGPNMSLARDLLQNGEKEVVLKYFKLCAKFWSKKSSKLPKWTQEVQEGLIPDFGANLTY